MGLGRLAEIVSKEEYKEAWKNARIARKYFNCQDCGDRKEIRNLVTVSGKIVCKKCRELKKYDNNLDRFNNVD